LIIDIGDCQGLFVGYGLRCYKALTEIEDVLVKSYTRFPCCSIEIQFNPKFELTYNYNLVCNIKRKARPLTLNIKGEGYQIHHTVMADEPQVRASATEACKLDYGEFFINEVKTKQV
jgi:hypothetical protein